jgi:integrase/recombinase XerD
MRWPVKFIDLANGKLLPRYKNDPEVNDYNMIIEMDRSKHNEINRAFRIRKEMLDLIKFSREVVVFDQRECFLKYMETEAKRRFGKKEIDRKTFQNTNATRQILTAYDPVCLFSSINKKWMKEFKLFLENYEHRPGKKYTKGTIWARIKDVKTYLELASKEPMLYVNAEAIDFPNPKPVYSTTFCNKEELRRLMILHRDGTGREIEHQVLGAFLFTCFTSLRISDLYRVNSQWQISAGCLKFIPKKNEKKQRFLEIPIMPLANHFIHNVTGIYFDLPTEQEYNRTLKDIAKTAEINKKLSSHVGRHTFGYLYMTTVGNIRGLQEILGHAKLETTERYAHLDDDYQKTAVRQIQDQFSDLILRKVN